MFCSVLLHYIKYMYIYIICMHQWHQLVCVFIASKAARPSSRQGINTIAEHDDLDDLMEEVLREAPRASQRSAAPAQQAARRLLEKELWATASSAVRVSKELSEPREAEERTPLARLLVASYVAVNVAPLFGQRPESHGTAHAPPKQGQL